jgi:hypothetical protein
MEIKTSVQYSELLKTWIATVEYGKTTVSDLTCKSKGAATHFINRHLPR